MALLAPSIEVILVHHFFSKLHFNVNIVDAFRKRNGELIIVQHAKISRLININELRTDSGANHKVHFNEL